MNRSRAATAGRGWRPPPNLPVLGLAAIAGAIAWTLLGALISAIGGALDSFWREWVVIQGFFAVAAAFFLGGLALSPALEETLRQLNPGAVGTERWTLRRRVATCRQVVVVFVAVVGTCTTTRLGFAVPPPGRYFMWTTCAVVCISAGFVTWHSVEVVRAAARLDTVGIKFFVYSPGDTKSLKRVAVHFVIFGLSMTCGYVFAFIGTLSPLWRGDPTFIRMVQVFWPLIYVPLCLTVTTYPHLAIHRLIRQEKDRLILSYQEQINSIIGDGRSLAQQDIERVNALADLIKRIDTSPSFAINFPIALGAALTYAVNIGSLIVPKELVGQFIRGLLPHH